jgi:hypothetical protein
VVLHLLTKRRQDLVAARTQTINRLLMDLVPGGARRNLTAKRAAALLAGITPAGQPAVTRWQLAQELVADVRQLEQQIAAVEARIKAVVAQAGSGRHSRCPRTGRPAVPAAGQQPQAVDEHHRLAAGLVGALALLELVLGDRLAARGGARLGGGHGILPSSGWHSRCPTTRATSRPDQGAPPAPVAQVRAQHGLTDQAHAARPERAAVCRRPPWPPPARS